MCTCGLVSIRGLLASGPFKSGLISLDSPAIAISFFIFHPELSTLETKLRINPIFAMSDA